MSRLLKWMVRRGWLHQNPWTKGWFFGPAPEEEAAKRVHYLNGGNLVSDTKGQRCCEQGNFGELHDCAKGQPSESTAREVITVCATYGCDRRAEQGKKFCRFHVEASEYERGRRDFAELEATVRALLVWVAEPGYIRDTDGSRKQIKLVQAALAATSGTPTPLPECGCERDKCFAPISGYSCRAENEASGTPAPRESNEPICPVCWKGLERHLGLHDICPHCGVHIGYEKLTRPLAATSGTPAPQEASKCEKSANVKSSAPARQITSGARTRSVDAESEKHNGTPAPRDYLPGKHERGEILSPAAPPPADETLPAEHNPARAPHNKFASLWCDACPRPASGTPTPATTPTRITPQQMSEVFAKSINATDPEHEHIYDHRIAADLVNEMAQAAAPGGKGPTPDWCDVCNASQMVVEDGEHVCGLTAYEAYSLGWRRGNNASHPLQDKPPAAPELSRDNHAWLASATPRPDLIAVSEKVWGVRFDGQMVCAPTIEEAVTVLRSGLAAKDKPPAEQFEEEAAAHFEAPAPPSGAQGEGLAWLNERVYEGKGAYTFSLTESGNVGLFIGEKCLGAGDTADEALDAALAAAPEPGRED